MHEALLWGAREAARGSAMEQGTCSRDSSKGTIRCLCAPVEGVAAEGCREGAAGAPAPLRTFLSLALCCRKSVLPPFPVLLPLNRYQMWFPCASHYPGRLQALPAAGWWAGACRAWRYGGPGADM